MGTASYVLVGTDAAAELSFSSSCHGAGRAMSRGAARRSITGQELRRQLGSRGIVVRCPSNAELAEEAPSPTRTSTRWSKWLKSGDRPARVRLRPLGVVKGLSASHRFEDHTGEVAFAIRADTLPELFRQAGAGPGRAAPRRLPSPPGPRRDGAGGGAFSGPPTLLVDCYNELIYRAETLGAVWSEIADLRVTGTELAAELRGASQSELAVEVKAATLHDARLEPVSGGFEGHLVLDV